MKTKKLQAVFVFKGRVKGSGVLFLFLFLMLSLSAGCGSAGIESVTGASTSTVSGGTTLSLTADKSKISFSNTEPFTLTATLSCPNVACLSESNGVTFSYSSNGIISSANGTGTVDITFGVDDDDAFETLTGSAIFQWTGITPTARGTAIIAVSVLSPAMTTSISVQIE